jgi:hypothetical protein
LKLRDKNGVVLIDPTDIDHPPSLNMFDVKLSDDPVERERILNGTVELYQYLFVGLLGAELTMKQGALFGFIARLLISIPGATIHTLIDLMEHGERYREHINRLTGTSRRFFETQFFHRKFSATKGQIISRLYGALGIPTVDRIFSHESVFASAMKVDKKALQNVRKYPDASEFVCFVRNVTDRAVKVTVRFFTMELAGELNDEELEKLLDTNRERYTAPWEEGGVPATPPPP